MVGWLTGIGVAGFLVSFGLSVGARPPGNGDSSSRSGPRRRWASVLGPSLVGAGLALLFAWPAWLLGHFVGPHYEVSPTTGGAVFACIFGLGGAGLSGALRLVLNERRKDS